MAQFKPIKAMSKTALDNIEIKDGQFIVCGEEKKLYFDISDTERIPIGTDTTTSGDGIKYVSFSSGTDEEIKTILDAYYQGKLDIADYWSVGDTRKIHLNEVANPKGSGTAWPEQDITIVITDIKHHDLTTPINGITKAAITCQTRECVNNSATTEQGSDWQIYPNLKSSEISYNRTWASSAIGMRTWGNDVFYNTMLPEKIRNMIKSINRRVEKNHGGKEFSLATDKVFLPAAYEILGGGDRFGGPVVGSQLEFYKTTINRVKYGNNNGSPNNTAQFWWTGSPTFNEESTLINTGWIYIENFPYNNSFSWSSHTGDYRHSYAPAFCM